MRHMEKMAMYRSGKWFNVYVVQSHAIVCVKPHLWWKNVDIEKQNDKKNRFYKNAVIFTVKSYPAPNCISNKFFNFFKHTLLKYKRYFMIQLVLLCIFKSTNKFGYFVTKYTKHPNVLKLAHSVPLMAPRKAKDIT
jgi:hypothetical protein